MMSSKRQAKINEVMGTILKGLAYDQHINGTPLTFSVGVRDGMDMINNVIVIHEAPREIMRDLGTLEERFPGVEVIQRYGGIWIDCEHIEMEHPRKSFGERLMELAGCTV